MMPFLTHTEIFIKLLQRQSLIRIGNARMNKRPHPPGFFIMIHKKTTNLKMQKYYVSG